MLALRGTLIRSFVACLVALTCFARFAPAQQRHPVRENIGIVWSPVTRREAEHYGVLLRLDHDQMAALVALHRGYRSEVFDVVDHLDEQAAKFDEASLKDASSRKDRYGLEIKALEETDRLTQTFFRDVAELLNESQRERQPAADRAQRRHVGLRLTICGPERADLVDMVSSLGLDHTPDLDEALASYEERLDRLMIEKARRIRRLFEEIINARIREGDASVEQIGDALSQLAKGSLVIRDLARDYARRIESLLPEEQRARWRREFNICAYPRAYSNEAIKAALAAARAVPTLTAAQRQSLDTIATDFDSQSGSLATAYITAVDRWQEQMAERDAFSVMSQADKASKDNPLHVATVARNELALATVAKIKGALTAAQLTEIKAFPTAGRVQSGADLLPIGDGYEEHEASWEAGDEIP